MREKKETLFNKNHITITKTICPKSVETNYFEEISSSSAYYYPTYRQVIGKRTWVPAGKKIIEKESPLGFVYQQVTTWDGHWEEEKKYFKTEDEHCTFAKYRFCIDNVIYDIVYPTQYKSNSIGVDARPWDIADGGMEDHFVNDLLKVTDDLIQIIIDAHIYVKPHKHIYSQYSNPEKYAKEPIWDDWSVSEWKQKLYKDLYGNPKGPRYMTNDEKILAHGFDLKSSFRKEKSK